MKKLAKIIALFLAVFPAAPLFAATNRTTGRQIASFTVTDNNLAAGSVGTFQIQNQAVIDNDIANGTITGAQISSPLVLKDSITIAIASKYLMDGAAGNDYISAVTDNDVQAFAGGVNSFSANKTRFSIGSQLDLWIDVAKKFFIDAGNDTYIQQITDNDMGFFSGGTASFDANTARVSIGSTRDFWVDPTKKINFDGGGDTYALESAANVLSIFAGGTESFSVNNSGVKIGNGATMAKYDEGTCTPTITIVGGASNTVPVYSTNSCRWERVGRLVWVDVYLTGDGGAEGAGTGQINILLPFTASANHQIGGFAAGSATNGATQFELAGAIPSSSTTIVLSNVLASLVTGEPTSTSFTGAEQNNTSRLVRLKFFYEI